jgi:thioredoxin reductase (NADPH)
MMFKMIKLPRVLVVSLLFMQGCIGVDKAHGNKPDMSQFDEAKAQQIPNVRPAVIIGSGPAGLGAALYIARENIRPVIIEGPLAGGLLTQTTEVSNWPGKKHITGPEIIKELREQVEAIGADFVADTVESVDFSQWPYKITLGMAQEPLYAREVIIATGASPKKLGVPGEQEYFGRNVSSCAKCDAMFYKGEDVVVVGGGDSAVEEALQLVQHVKSVTILVRKDHMRAAASGQNRLKDYPNIKVMYNVEVKKVIGDGKKVTGVELLNHATKQTSTLPTAGVFLAIGHTPNSELFKDWLDLDSAGYIKMVGRTQKTSRPGVFAAGEVEDHRYRQGGSSAGDGTKAGLDALEFLREIGYNQLEENKKLTKAPSAARDGFEVPQITSYQEFEQACAGDTPVVIDFYSKSCSPCQQMLPLVTEAAREMAPQVRFFKVDAEHAGVQELTKKCFVYKVPCLLVFNKGSLVARYTKIVTSKDELVGLVNEFLSQK